MLFNRALHKRDLMHLIFLQDCSSKSIGVAAQLAGAKDPLNSFYSVKRLIGRSYAECARYAGSLVYSLAEGPNGEAYLWSPAR